MRTFLLIGILGLRAAAQTPIEPPVLIQLIRTPGGEDTAIRPYSRAGAAVDVFGLRSMTGEPETWLIEAHDSFASIEALDKAILAAGEVRSRNDVFAPSRTMVALYRPDWSYRPDQAIKMFPKARYLQISLHRIRLGADGEFGELIRLRRSGLDRINLDRPDIAYQVVLGAPSQLCVFLAPLTSLKTLDDALDRMPVSFRPGGRPGSNIAPDVELSREHLLLRVEPAISRVSEGFVSADPEFWSAGKR